VISHVPVLVECLFSMTLVRGAEAGADAGAAARPHLLVVPHRGKAVQVETCCNHSLENVRKCNTLSYRTVDLQLYTTVESAWFQVLKL